MDDEILTLVQALKLLPIGDDKLRRMAKAKEIPCRKVGGRYLFIKSDLIAWIRDGYADAHKGTLSCTTGPPRLVGAALTKAYEKALERTPSKKR